MRTEPLPTDICVTGLVLATQVSRPLFDEVEKVQRVPHVMDKIKERWGTSTIFFGPMHVYRRPMENEIAFGRIPDEFD